ncbi:hypothetical protein PSAC2689_20146 [Paraburkholderia sacchari]
MAEAGIEDGCDTKRSETETKERALKTNGAKTTQTGKLKPARCEAQARGLRGPRHTTPRSLGQTRRRR